ncbi:S9 family peptidase [Brevundimonas sp. NIBR11]|uniref:S9 family peptidase n=1 Tax=Brevundimonas sp. NIBR11 TaxID=3015999 RepID=UPI0022F05F74|nr:S9 family peptidase [Brevundimonas sp. NIBR11]WGM31011.1 Dipeptidyl aminopeptidase BI [Brevundimonas sp. NIBR11]
MNRREFVATTAASALVAAASPALARSPGAPMSPTPPVAKRIPVVIEQLGRTRTDDYQWMKDDNWQAVLRDPTLIKADVKEHLEAENAYREAMLASTRPLQALMFEEMKGRIKEDDSSVPSPDGPWEYFTEYRTGDQHPRYMRVERQGTWFQDGRMVTKNFIVAPTPQLLLDCNVLAQGKAYSEVSAVEHSPDHSLFAYAEDAQGSEVHRIYVKDLATGEVLPDVIQSATGNFTFSPDSQWIFWTNRDDNGRPDKIFRRPARGGEITLVYEEADDGMFMGVERTSDDAFIVIGIQNQETSEARYIPGERPTSAPQVLAEREVAVRYDADHWSDRWVIRTNADDAIDFKIVQVSTERPARAGWTDLVPHTPGRFIEGMALVKNFIARQERADANTKIVIRSREGDEHEIAVDEPAYALSLGGASEFETTTMRYGYNSPSTPTSTYDYDLRTRERVLRKVQEVPSGHDPADYVVERLNAPATDGQLVPVTVLRRRTTRVDGSAPVLLYGYGSYGIPMAASFSTNRLSLVDRGWIYAIAHIRGGSDKGWGWFLEGRKFKKKNTFTDFTAAADHLIAQSYARAGHIVAQGGSAGGLLMGAVTNMRPELWAGVIGQVPFVDVINTMSDTTLPLTPPEWPEWGNPIEDVEAYDYIASYSPYDNVEAKAYPAILATGGLSDPRVTYWEPEKWVAKLRPATTSGKPVLLKINMEAGHGGASGRFDYLKEVAHDHAFAVWAIEKGWETA